MQNKLNIQGTVVLERILDDWNQFKILVEEGGSRSSKTTSILQALLIETQSNPGLVYTIVRNKLTWIRSTVLVDFARVVKELGLTVTPDVNPNRADQVYYINGSEFAFFGLDYPQKLHGRSQDRFWMNEVMECSKMAFDQLEMRTRLGGILDYNPSDDMHWVFDLQKRPDVVTHHSTMLDNPFLPDSIINKIKSFEPTEENIANGTADAYMWEVYGLGNPARMQGAIFTNWDEVDRVPRDARFVANGLDFGFSNHPSALIGLYLFDRELYLDEIIYETGLTNPQIATRMEENGVMRSDETFGDSAEPKSIAELQNLGWNVQAAEKGQDSIMFGIDLLKGYRIHITKRSVNLAQEFRRYKWAEDKDGKSLNKPIDAFNHGIDAVRYAATMKLREKPKVTIQDIRDIM